MRSIAVVNFYYKPFMERRVRVNGAGEGGILVCNEGGNIKMAIFYVHRLKAGTQ
jgi:hypothetical protein